MNTRIILTLIATLCFTLPAWAQDSDDEERVNNVTAAKRQMDKQIAESAGILADQAHAETLALSSFERTSRWTNPGYSAPTTMLGMLDKSIIDRVVKQHLDDIQACYAQQKATNPDLASGIVTVRFTIGPDGTVSSVRTERSELDNEFIESCVCSQFEQMEFPSPRGGPVIMLYPIALR